MSFTIPKEVDEDLKFFEKSYEDFLSGKPAFLTFTPTLLMQNIPKIFDPKKLILQVEDNILINPEAVAILKDYKLRGYEMAVTGFDFYNRFLEILPNMDYMKVDFSNPNQNRSKIQDIIQISKQLGKKTIAYQVNT